MSLTKYRKKLYSNYATIMRGNLRKSMGQEQHEKQFPIWESYYLKHFPESRNIKILEIGCGNGGFLYYLKIKKYCDYFGVDISLDQINEARSILDNHCVEQADLQEFLKGKIGVYDVIVARDVLEHFKKEELFDVLQLIFAALSDRGRLIMQSPNAEGIFGARYRYSDFTHEVAFTQSSISQVLYAVGFQDVQCYSTGPVIHGLKSFVRWLFWKMIETIVKFCMLVETGSAFGIYTQNMIGIARK